MSANRWSASYLAATLVLGTAAACGSTGDVDDALSTGTGGAGLTSSAGGSNGAGTNAGGSLAASGGGGASASLGGAANGGSLGAGNASSVGGTGGLGAAGASGTSASTGGSNGDVGAGGTNASGATGGATAGTTGTAGSSGSGISFGGANSFGGMSSDGGGGTTSSAGGASSGGQDGGGGSSTQPECSEEAQYVYVLTDTDRLYKFDPPNLTFTLVGTINCGTPLATPYSMAVARNGQAYSVFTNGKLYTFDVTTAKCSATPFKANQNGFSTFGMGFSSMGAASETLFVANSDMTGLASIDLNTWKLTPIGNYDLLMARAELTGTSAGQLFGAFEGSPYVVAQIDESNAHILSQAPQSAINYPPSSSNFAFAFWGGDFWLFVGPGGSTDVFQYDPTAGTTTMVKSVNFEIVGAGVSTCAPLVKP